MDLWRISNHRSLNGEGGRRYAARWHTAGSPVVYLAASPPGALIEILVHLELGEWELPPTYTLLHVSFPAKILAKIVPTPLHLPAGNAWTSNLLSTRALGDAWLKSQASALARVPSAILPATFNYLLNPLHPDAARITLAGAHPVLLDPRLLR